MNGITLLLLSAYFLYEGVRRLIDPPEVEGAYVVVTGLAGWARADALAALVVAGLMLKAGWGLVRDAGRVFIRLN
ncbi:hypothetical protein Q9G87_25755 [Nonomuraea sp. G32]|nr:hypothetical protein [Nonomuraea sp. G32]MDP4505398.1 hypothetical protein [Nonomuraea sp. G32]